MNKSTTVRVMPFFNIFYPPFMYSNACQVFSFFQDLMIKQHITVLDATKQQINKNISSALLIWGKPHQLWCGRGKKYLFTHEF